MAVDVTSTPKTQAGTPHVLFKLPDPLASDPIISSDGQQFVVAMPVK
jgi:hypothetical protein